MPRQIAALIRHAQYRQLPDTPSAHQPFALTADGKNQASQAAELIKETVVSNGWTLIPVLDSSQLLRAWQTANIIREQLRNLSSKALTVEGFDELAERSLGSANNLTLQQIQSIAREDPRFTGLPPDWKSNSQFRLPLQGAESLMQAGARVAGHMQQTMTSLTDNIKTTSLKIFVGHGAAFRHAAHHLGVLGFEDIARLSMYHAQPVYLEYLPGGQWRQIGGEWKVRGEENEPAD